MWPRYGAERAPSNVGSAPLSLVKITIVFSSSPRAFSPSSSRPICLSISASTGFRFRGTSFLSDVASGTHGVCGSSSHRFTKTGLPWLRARNSSVLSTKNAVRSHRFTLSWSDQIQFVAVMSGCGSGLSYVPTPSS